MIIRFASLARHADLFALMMALLLMLALLARAPVDVAPAGQVEVAPAAVALSRAA